ncbi:MAG: threonine--tRNA ligase [Oligoflexia bacterium]|nr:threonine--tRNA ligase [Oligoflexia bacterium]
MAKENPASVADFEEPEIHSEVDTMRHSCAHVMAHAIQRLWPQAKFGIGPTVENGFFYDVDLDVKLTPEDLPRIEAEMAKLIKANQEFVRAEHSIAEGLSLFGNLNQPFKIEIIETLRDSTGATTVSSYKEGDFVDLCRGPHVKKTGDIKAFKLLSLAGAYWRGNEKNPQLQRIYGTAFTSKAELDEYLHLLEEAKKRDHRKLGKELELFTFLPESPASPFFYPKGAIVYNRLIQYIRDLYVPYEYSEVITPQVMDVSLWKTSGHYDNYVESMYFTKVEDREYGLKPMNCPSHCVLFGTLKHSYRDLPLRYADFGRLHRYEKSGVTHGLTRVRTFCQDDAHVFCTPEQIETEILKVVEMVFRTLDLFGFSDMQIFLSTRPEKRVGSDALWDKAEAGLRATLDKLGRPYKINPGDGAFYGPKIDFIVKDALKRPWQLSTIQLDFNLPERFDLTYTAADNTAQRPVMVHRAVLGSLERFIGVLTEHLGGAFPFWLAPVQARLVPIKDSHNAYCAEFLSKLKGVGYRVDLDDRNESMGLKTREAQTAKIPFSLVAGDREMQGNQFAVRKYGERESKVMTQDELLTMFAELESIPRQPRKA